MTNILTTVFKLLVGTAGKENFKSTFWRRKISLLCSYLWKCISLQRADTQFNSIGNQGQHHIHFYLSAIHKFMQPFILFYISQVKFTIHILEKAIWVQAPFSLTLQEKFPYWHIFWSLGRKRKCQILHFCFSMVRMHYFKNSQKCTYLSILQEVMWE